MGPTLDAIHIRSMDRSKFIEIKDLNILYVTSYYKPAYVYGGPVRSIASLCEKITRDVAKVTVFSTNANRNKPMEVPLGQPVIVDGVEVWYFPLSFGGEKYFYSRSQASAIRQYARNYDIVISEATWANASEVTKIACHASNIPYVIPLRGQFFPATLKQKRLKKQLYLILRGRKIINHAAALHATDEIESQAVKKLGFSPPVFIVPNGIDAEKFSRLPERGKYRQIHNISMDSTVILFLGRLHPNKQPDVAIRACHLINLILGNDVHLILAGPDEGKLRNQLEVLAYELGIENLVHFTGTLEGDEIVYILADTDLLIAPTSVQENFGMAALEALATGVPLLVSDKVPVGYWAEKVNAGQVVSANAEAFCKAACDILKDPIRMKAMGERGRDLVRDRYSIDQVARQLLAHYQAIVETGKPLEGTW